MDTGRRYGAGALEFLERVRDGHPWRIASAESFGGNGSFGNGAAMRVAPLGAYFTGDPARAADQAAALASGRNPSGWITGVSTLLVIRAPPSYSKSHVGREILE